MAGGWLKMRDDLDGDESVLSISATTGLDIDAVIGKLWRVWRWAGMNSTNGRLPLATPAMLDRVALCDGFASAMKAAAWLEHDENPGLVFPKWSTHNSKSAKTRALAARRMANKRANVLRDEANKRAPRAEQSRAEQKRAAAEQKSLNTSAAKQAESSAQGSCSAAAASLDPAVLNALYNQWPRSPYKAEALASLPGATPERVLWLIWRSKTDKPQPHRPHGFIEKGIREAWPVDPAWLAKYHDQKLRLAQ